MRIELWNKPIDLGPLFLSATAELDLLGLGGHPGRCFARRAHTHDSAEARASACSKLAPVLRGWATADAEALGFTTGVDIALLGMHATFQRGADRHVQPHVVLQFSRTRDDLAQPGLIPAVVASTTVIASPSGWVRYVIAKPLPPPSRQTDTVDDTEHTATWFRDRQEWARRVTASDPVSPLVAEA